MHVASLYLFLLYCKYSSLGFKQINFLHIHLYSVYRDVRLHYGGSFVEDSLIPGLDLYEWNGGAYVDAVNVTIEPLTLEGVTRLFTKYCPLEQSMNLRFYYMVGSNRFELDKDLEVKFAWCLGTAGGVDDVMGNLYCISDLVLPSTSVTTQSNSVTMGNSVHNEEVVNFDEAPPINNTQEFQTQEYVEVSSPIKGTAEGPRRSVRIAGEKSVLGSPSANTRFFELRKSPTKRTVNKHKQKSTLKSKHVKSKKVLDVYELDDPLPKKSKCIIW